jgi:tetratricopeptide (TPR) repeat protein
MRHTDPLPRHRLIAAGLIALAVASAYAAGLEAPFYMDDISSIQANASLRHCDDPLAMVWYPADRGRTIDGRPVLNLSFAVNRFFTGDSPRGYRTVNIGIHIIAALLVADLVRRLLSRETALRPATPAAWAAPTVAALLWSLHPVHTAAVTSIVQRAECLSAALMLGAIDATMAGIIGGGRWRLLLIAALSGLAGATKETAAVAPIVTIALDRAFLSADWRAVTGHWRWHAAAAACLPVVVVTTFVMGGRGGSAGAASIGAMWLYLLTQCHGVWIYLKTLIWPHPLVFDYGSRLSTGLAESWLPLLATTVVATVIVIGFRRSPRLWIAPLLFFVLLAPSSSVIPVKTQTIAEHRIYLASAPLIAAVAFLALCRPAAAPLRRIIWVVIAGLLLAEWRLTAIRNTEYLSPATIWTGALAAAADNPRAMINLAHHRIAAGELEEAAILLEQSAHAAEYRLEHAVNLAALHDRRGDLVAAEAAMTHAISLRPQPPAALLAERGRLRWRQGNLTAAIADLDTAMRLDAADPGIQVNRGCVLLDLQRHDEAIACFNAALLLDDRRPTAWMYRGLALAALGDRRTAEEDLRRAVALAPHDFEPAFHWGVFLAEQHRDTEAAAALTAAIAARPGAAEAYYNRAAVLLRQGATAATRRDLARFVELGGSPTTPLHSALESSPATAD